MDDILQQIAGLPPEKRALIVERNSLSFSQERLWFLHQLNAADTSYNLQYAVALKGSLDTRALAISLQEVMRRHESLRTRFPVVDSQPIQLVSAESFDILESSDLSGLPASERESAVARLRVGQIQQAFDLSMGPLIRARLVRLSDAEHVLLLTMHHIVTDGWSTGVLMRELGQLYEAFAAGRPSQLADLPIQYRDYALWQREYLQGEVLEKDLAYWRDQLVGAPEILELPTDRPRPAVQQFCGASEPFALDEELTRGLQRLSSNESTTLFMTMWSAFVVLLYRYTGVEDIVVGTPIANRTQHETEGLIGFFVNMLVLRTKVQAEESYRGFLQRAREVALGAYEHQNLPFEKLVEELRPVRSLSHNPLFQILFEVQNAPRTKFELPNLQMVPLVSQTTTTKFDLVLSVTEARREIGCVLTYDTDLFDRATIARMVGHFKTLLRDIVAHPEKPVSVLSLLTEMDRQQILGAWNDTYTDYCFDKSVSQLFSERAHLTPEAVAVVFQEEQITYRKLNEKANEVARSLREHGVGKGAYVPVLMERSTELVIAWLAIMKAGAAFIPLDTNWPLERLRRLVNELNSALIVVNRESMLQIEGLVEPLPLLVETSAVNGLTAGVQVDIAPDDPIYAIYTSGSTGKPKAAVAAHSGIVNRLFWMNDFFGREAAAVSLQTTRPVYDSAVWEIFWPLINGGKAVIPSPRMEMTAADLTSMIARHGVTIVDLVPSVFNTIVPQLISNPEMQAKLQSVRCIIVGGEEITSAMAYKFVEHFPAVKVTNLYGPTEASIGCISYQLTGKAREKIPIGKPISNVQVFILDHMNPVPVGVAGEIYLSGVCVGLGYLNDEERTRAVFIDNPFKEFGNRVLYKTGDRARYLPDGNIEYLGRVDRQVKMRGLRIELGEIEAALREHDAVSKALAVVNNVAGKQRIVAYVVAEPNRELASGTLSKFLRERLPDYMVPTNFIPLEAVPLTPGGKVDWRALPPVPENLLAGRQADYVAPQTPVQQALAEIWAEVLGVDRVSTTDDFFELGGHSLLATQLVSRIRVHFEIELPLRRLFEAPTLAELALEIEASQRNGVPDQATSIRRRPREAESLLARIEQLSGEEVDSLLEDVLARADHNR